LVGILEHQLPQLARLQLTPLALEQLAAQALLQLADLTGDRLRRQKQGLGGLGDRALLLGHPEIIEVVVIQV
jgi:hypothetical protein